MPTTDLEPAPDRQQAGKVFDQRAKNRVLRLVAKGVPGPLAAEKIHFTWATVRRHMRDDPVFAEKMRDAEDHVDAEVEGKLLERAREGNVDAIKTWLYNRKGHRWKDQKVLRQEISGPNGGPIEIAQATVMVMREVLSDPDTRSRALGLVRAIPAAGRDAGASRADGDPLALDAVDESQLGGTIRSPEASAIPQ